MGRSRTKQRQVEHYTHQGKERVNNPPVGLVTPDTDGSEDRKTYKHDPHIDPQLQWAGKQERTSFEIPTVSLHVHERIDPHTIIEAVRKRPDGAPQLSLFSTPEENPPIRQAIEFYKHRQNWTNRLIAGDSLLVMNSLLEKEGLGGKVQTIYIDPPYGVRYRSNFQPFVSQHSPAGGDQDRNLTAEPEQIRAFRDTWELGIHSYLAYLRDRLLLAHDLLHESGSCFVQIGDENVHRVGMVMDEIFGAENRVATITYATTSGSSAKTLPEIADYLLWYARDLKKMKYRQLYEPLDRKGKVELFRGNARVELLDGTCRKLTDEERFNPDRYLPKGARIYRRRDFDSQGASTTGRSDPYEWNGRIFPCPQDRHWSISKEGMDRLAELGRLDAAEGQARLCWKRYEGEVPGKPIHNVWAAQMSAQGKRYVVQTAIKPIQRCILMTSDPGDIVLDPTCGSGTTAYVAEQWGRRWITCDTSRVAVAVARQRLLTAIYDYYELAHPNEGVGAGFRYRSIQTVSPKILGYDEEPHQTILYDQPLTDRGKMRVAGPFTVEAVPAPTVKPLTEVHEEPSPDSSLARSGETVRQNDWRDELLKTGVRGKAGQRISFARLEPLPAMRFLHAEGETRPDTKEDTEGGAYTTIPQRVVVSFGPDHTPLEQRQVALAIEEAYSLVPKPSIIVFAAFQFDPEASKDIDETNWPGVTLLKAQMNVDLLTDDLKRKRASNESFWLIGQPDVAVERLSETAAEEYQVSVHGFDYFNMETGDIESGDSDKIAMWMLDTDYDGRSLFPRQVFFLTDIGEKDLRRLEKNLKAEVEADLIRSYVGTRSLPFKAGQHRRAAVKIIDDRGIESLKIMELE
ncbi:MAG: site-specific DNA-methyltransferase [Rhodothermaceae bacterium]|nr:site-specific DNA-methyltransferase [Rhodothermaceae bacterium]MYI17727.1 site-specific DNA-methyltransferase [Rhodothermaceae bacterium]